MWKNIMPVNILPSSFSVIGLAFKFCLLAMSIVELSPFVGGAATSGSQLCRRWDHQTAVLDDKLYLFGGYKLLLENVNPDSKAYNHGAGHPTNEFMVLDLTKSCDLEKDKDLANPPKWQAIEAPYISQQTSPPGVAGGGLFTYQHPDGNGLLLYDGKFTPLGQDKANPKDRKSQCVSYGAQSKAWNLEDSWSNSQKDSVESVKISRFSRGTAVDIPGQNTGFYVGGARIWEGGSDYDWYYPEDVQSAQIDFEKKIVRKMKPMFNNKKTIGASVVWVPIGEKGSLIVVGGTDEAPDERRSGLDKNGKANAQNVRPAAGGMRSFAETLIYDIAEDEWHSQSTKGVPLPAARQNACFVSRSFKEPDGNITHQLFFYGGGSGSSFSKGDPLDDAVFFGDLYVLSLPAFRWLKFTEIPNAPAARTRHTCHVVNERHLFIIGGGRNDSLSKDAGLRDACVWDEISVLDMTKMEWQLKYVPNKEPYVVNKIVRDDSLVSGSPRTEPEAGWSPGVQKWFQSQYQQGDSNNNATSKFPLIIGVVVGSIAAAGLFMIIRFYYRRRRDRNIIVPATPYAGHQVGVAHGTQALPTSERGMSKATHHTPPSYGNKLGLGIGLSATAGPDIPASHLPILEMPTGTEGHPSGGHSIIGWGGISRHDYTPIAPAAVDDSGPYTFTTAGGRSFAAELDTNPRDGSAYELRKIDQDHNHTHQTHLQPAPPVAPSSVSEPSGFMDAPSAPMSPYIPSEGSSPRIGSEEPHHIKRKMTDEESKRVSQDLAAMMRRATASGTGLMIHDEERGELLHPALWGPYNDTNH